MGKDANVHITADAIRTLQKALGGKEVAHLCHRLSLPCPITSGAQPLASKSLHHTRPVGGCASYPVLFLYFFEEHFKKGLGPMPSSQADRERPDPTL